MRLFIAIWSLVPPWSEAAQSPSSSLCFWNVHHSSVSPISHLNACSSCLRRFLCSPSQPVLISSSLTNIISKLKTVPLPRLFMKMLSCVVPGHISWIQHSRSPAWNGWFTPACNSRLLTQFLPMQFSLFYSCSISQRSFGERFGPKPLWAPHRLQWQPCPFPSTCWSLQSSVMDL